MRFLAVIGALAIVIGLGAAAFFFGGLTVNRNSKLQWLSYLSHRIFSRA